MDFKQSKLPESAESDFTALQDAITSGQKDQEKAEALLTATVEKAAAFDKAEDQSLALKSYAAAYEAAASAPEHFEATAEKITETTDKMIERQTTGQFKTDENTATTLEEDEFLSKVTFMANLQVGNALFDEEFAATGLPDTPKVKLAYQVYMEDIVTNQTKMEEMLEAQAAMTKANADELKQAFYVDQNTSIQNTISAAKKYAEVAEAGNPETSNVDKAAVPFLVYSSLRGQYQGDEGEENFNEDFDEVTRYWVDSAIWGSYKLADQIEAYFAKDSMFKIALVPLKEENAAEQKADADEKPEDKKVKTIPLPQAVQYFEEKGNFDAARGAVREAVVPLLHVSGETKIFPLPAVFDKIEQDPEYRNRVVSEIQTELPPLMSLSDVIAEHTIDRATSPGKILNITPNPNLLAGLPVPEEMKKAMKDVEQDTVGKHIVAIQNLEASEDTAECAEMLMINAMVAVDSATASLSDFKASLFPGASTAQTDFFYVQGKKDPQALQLVPVDALAPQIERSVDFLLTVQKVFAKAPEKGDKELNLLPQFETTSPEMQQKFKTFMQSKNQDLSTLQQVLINTARKRQAQAEAKAAEEARLAKEEAERQAEAERKAQEEAAQKAEEARIAAEEKAEKERQAKEKADKKAASKAKRKKWLGF